MLRQGTKGSLLIFRVASIFALLLMFTFPSVTMGQDTLGSDLDPIPTLAYYYIWYDATSWDRAKTDFPLLGRYSSDDRQVMEEHVRMAQEAGIDGFIVSWKSTYKLDQRLEQLMDIAALSDFHLWVMYEGLDFERYPLDIERIGNDFQYFLESYGDHPAFNMYDQPVMIWSGTWEFSPEAIESIAESFRGRLYLLSSERNVEGYLRVADVVDGNAYYWSSVDPVTSPDHTEKLQAMSSAVHEHGGIWVAPAAPGFDARLIGGTRVIERDNGQTFRLQLGAALRSDPDAIGIISWNEFSENTHIEPSENYGSMALDLLARRQMALPSPIVSFDSSEPGTTGRDRPSPQFLAVGALLLFTVSMILVVARRNRQTESGNVVG